MWKSERRETRGKQENSGGRRSDKKEGREREVEGKEENKRTAGEGGKEKR